MDSRQRTFSAMTIFDYHWDFGPVWTNFPVLLHGLVVTLQLTGLAIALGTPFGILLGLAMRARLPVVRYPIVFFIDAIRSLPVLILILWVYYFVPVLIGIPRMSAFWLATIALTLNLAAFIADIVRASVSAFPKGLTDAAYACGLSKFSTFRHIVLPEIIREILPTLALLYIAILKLSSLASVITVYELVHTADRIRVETFQAIEVFSMVALIYLALIMPLSAFVRFMEGTKYFKRRS